MPKIKRGESRRLRHGGGLESPAIAASFACTVITNSDLPNAIASMIFAAARSTLIDVAGVASIRLNIANSFSFCPLKRAFRWLPVRISPG